MSSRPTDWRHDNTGRLFFDSTRRFQERVLALVNKSYPEMRIAHMAVTRHIDLSGTRVADLAVRAGVTKQSMGEMVDQLEAMGFVTRMADVADRRAKIVRFTVSGQRLLDVIRKAVAATERDLALRIGGRAVAEVRAALTAYCRIDDALDKAPERPRIQRRTA